MGVIVVMEQLLSGCSGQAPRSVCGRRVKPVVCTYGRWQEVERKQATRNSFEDGDRIVGKCRRAQRELGAARTEQIGQPARGCRRGTRGVFVSRSSALEQEG